jgi:hypothetical protein
MGLMEGDVMASSVQTSVIVRVKANLTSMNSSIKGYVSREARIYKE